MTWLTGETASGERGKRGNPLRDCPLPLRGHRVLARGWSPTNKDPHPSPLGRHLLEGLNILPVLSQRVWRDGHTWVVFLGQLLQGYADLCCSKYDLQITFLRIGVGRSDFSVSVSPNRKAWETKGCATLRLRRSNQEHPSPPS